MPIGLLRTCNDPGAFGRVFVCRTPAELFRAFRGMIQRRKCHSSGLWTKPVFQRSLQIAPFIVDPSKQNIDIGEELKLRLKERQVYMVYVQPIEIAHGIRVFCKIFKIGDRELTGIIVPPIQCAY